MCKNWVKTTTSFAITSLKKITLLKLVMKYILNKNVVSIGSILRQPCFFTPHLLLRFVSEGFTYQDIHYRSTLNGTENMNHQGTDHAFLGLQETSAITETILPSFL